jgi:tetratricopeptide (TPR) repeat protein
VRHALQLLGAAALALAPVAAADSPALDRLEQAVAEHPEDPDLRWALARALARADRLEEAVATLAESVRRWPDHRADAELNLGVWLYELERDAEAATHLERALRRDPSSGAANLYLGLAYKHLGRFAEAEAALAAAARSEPELRDDAALLQALMRLDLGDEAGGERLLHRAIALDPEGDPARSARLILGERARPRPPRIELEAVAGVEYDSNVVLDGGTDLPGLTGDREDARFTWGSTLTTRPVISDRWMLTAGYRYDQSAHLDLHDYDTRGHTGFLSAQLGASDRVVLRMDGLIGYAELGRDPYLLSGTLRPNLLLVIGPRAGALRLFGEVESLDYDESVFLPSLERDGWGWGGGLEHAVAIPGWEGAWGTLGASFRRSETEGSSDLLGFDSAYDHDRWRGLLRLGLPLAWRLRSELSFALGHERYDHRNVIDFLTGVLGGGSLDPSDARRRRDLVAELRIRLLRPVTRFADAELSWRYFDRGSNVAL